MYNIIMTAAEFHCRNPAAVFYAIDLSLADSFLNMI